LIWTVPAAIVIVAVVIFGAQWLRTLDPVQAFLHDYPGSSPLPSTAPVGLPVWLNWQHFLNALFLLLIVRTGWQVRTTKRPPMYWTRHNGGLIRTANPPKRISIHLWMHLSFDLLWVVNGVVFIVLLFATGQWMRIVPTSWAVVPNAVSAALQYASLDWPTEDGWVNYNGLQLLTYFVTVFIAAPLAILTGVRMSGLWPRDAARLNRIYPIQLARAIHFPVMLYFVLFVIVHVVLVLATGALRNLNHMYASHDTIDWVGFALFSGSVILMTAVWLVARPTLVMPAAAAIGKVSR
jgi:thiosulfate reductase cytochrome b subunit